jgi:hypothetical protein
VAIDLRGLLSPGPCLSLIYEVRATDGRWYSQAFFYSRFSEPPALATAAGHCVPGPLSQTYAFRTTNARLSAGPQPIRISAFSSEFRALVTLVDAVLIIDPWPGFDAPDGGPPP